MQYNNKCEKHDETVYLCTVTQLLLLPRFISPSESKLEIFRQGTERLVRWAACRGKFADTRQVLLRRRIFWSVTIFRSEGSFNLLGDSRSRNLVLCSSTPRTEAWTNEVVRNRCAQLAQHRAKEKEQLDSTVLYTRKEKKAP